MPLDFGHDIVARWSDLEPKYVPLLQEGGITAVLLPSRHEGFTRACERSGIETAALEDIQLLAWSGIAQAASGRPVVLASGLWPGISRGAVTGADDDIAGASREPWIDANGYWIGCLKALAPDRAPVLGYLPDEAAGIKRGRVIPFDSLELALSEAWASGGNYILALEPRYREALLRREPRAMAAWRRLGRTARWLQDNRALFRQPALPVVTVLVEPGEETPEIVNLMYRRNVSPALARSDTPPPPDPARRLALVAVHLAPPAELARARILSHAESGAAVITTGQVNDAWWRDSRLKLIRSEPERDFYALGRGQVIAYRDPITDPSEFALDVIDVITHKRRAVRLWNAPAVIALATSAPGGGALLHAVNYGSPAEEDIQARIQGVYARATLLRPDGAPMALQPARRGTTTEVMIPTLQRLATVRFG